MIAYRHDNRRHASTRPALLALAGIFLAAGGCGDSWSVSVQTPAGATARIVTKDGVTPIYFAETHEDGQVRAALEQRAEFGFTDVELEVALTYVAEKYQLPLQIDERAWSDTGIRRNQLVSASEVRAPLGTSLRNFLKAYGLVYAVRDGALWVTTTTYAAEYTGQRVYPVEDLVIAPNDPAGQQINFEALINAITSTIDQDSWQYNGGTEGNIVPFEGAGVTALIVSHHDDVHDQVAWLLTNLRQARSATVHEAQAKRPRVFMPIGTAAQMSGGGSRSMCAGGSAPF